MSDTPTTDTGTGGSELSRRDLLVKAGVVGAGAVAAGSIAGKATAAPKRIGATPKKGGKITFALEQDPVHIAPFGPILTSNHWGKEPMYESLVEWDSKLNIRPALAESWKVVDPRTVDFTLRRGVRFHNGKEVTAADVKYSVEGWLAPPLPGSGDDGQPDPVDHLRRGAEQVRRPDQAGKAGCTAVRRPGLDALHVDRAGGHVPAGERRPRGDRHRAVPPRQLHAGAGDRVRRVRRTTARRACRT